MENLHFDVTVASTVYTNTMHCVVVKHNEICGCENPVVSLLNTTQICRHKSLLYLMMSYCSTCCWEHDHNGKKPLAPVGKQVRCAVAPKNLCAAGDTYKLHYVALVQRRQKNYASVRRTSAHDGSCALSDKSLASAKPRFPHRQRKRVTWF